jgi:hypothetical protein
MNIINQTFLHIALWPKAVYKRMGVHIPHLVGILQTKLLMDDRRPTTMHQVRKNKQEKPVNLATIGTMFVSALLGLLYLLSFSIGSDKVTQLTFYFSMFFFMLSATLISDFTSVLIDVRDNYIILPKPVNDRTFVVARLLHISIHVCKIVLPMSLPGFIYMIYTTGLIGALIFLLVISFVTLFSIFFINAVYILILRLTTPQKFQSVISAIQIAFAIVIYASYQLFPRLIGELKMDGFEVSTKPGIVFYPLYWMACSWKLLFVYHVSYSELITGMLGILLPFASLFIVIKYLAPSFNNKLALINNSVAVPSGTVKKDVQHQKKTTYAEVLARIFTKGPLERMGFLFAWKMSSRSRDFKIKVYPGIGYLVVIIAMFFFNEHRSSLKQIAEQSNGGKSLIILTLYFSTLLLSMAIHQMIYSEKYKAAWIFYITPVARPGEIILGGAKGIIFKFYIPVVAVTSVAGIVLGGFSIIPNLILGLFNQLLIASLMVYISFRMFPFSAHQNINTKAGSFVRSIGTMIIMGLIGLGHYFIYNITSVVVICAALSIVATYLLMGSIRNTSWETIKSKYEE